MSTSLTEVTRFLDAHLRVSEIPDEPNALSGLQLEAKPVVTRIACAVDAGEPSIEEACRLGADLLVVHHGLLWGGNRPIVGPHARKLKRCFESGLSVYSVHLPLDVHPEVGNNALIVRALGLVADGTFGKPHNLEIGLTASCELSIEDLVQRVEGAMGACRAGGSGS